MKFREYDLPESCAYFKKCGTKTMHDLPMNETCMGISDISLFVDCISKNTQRMKCLKKVSIHWNILSYIDMENELPKLHGRIIRLGNELRKLKTLEHLEFRISRNQPKSLLSLFQNVVSNKQIKQLTFELQASKFQLEDISRITTLFKKTVSLEDLSLSFKRCLLSEEALTALFESLYKLVRLKKLQLNLAFMMNLKEDTIQMIIDLLEKLPQLDCLYINLSGTDIEDRHVKEMMNGFRKSKYMKQCCVKVGSCRKVSFIMASQANGLKGFVVTK